MAIMPGHPRRPRYGERTGVPHVPVASSRPTPPRPLRPAAAHPLNKNPGLNTPGRSAGPLSVEYLGVERKSPGRRRRMRRTCASRLDRRPRPRRVLRSRQDRRAEGCTSRVAFRWPSGWNGTGGLRGLLEELPDGVEVGAQPELQSSPIGEDVPCAALRATAYPDGPCLRWASVAAAGLPVRIQHPAGVPSAAVGDVAADAPPDTGDRLNRAAGGRPATGPGT